MRVLSSIKASKDAITKEYVDGNIPTKVSQLTNDSGFITDSKVVVIEYGENIKYSTVLNYLHNGYSVFCKCYIDIDTQFSNGFQYIPAVWESNDYDIITFSCMTSNEDGETVFRNISLEYQEENGVETYGYWNDFNKHLQKKLVSGISIKTINNQSILGSGNINIFDAVYPVGSIYMSVNSTNPTTLFGGTWEQIKDKFLLSAGDTYNNGDEGGEATHKLTTSELPSHAHKHNPNDDKAIGMSFKTGTGNKSYRIGSQSSGQYVFSAGSSASLEWATSGTAHTGGGEAHNNMPPYLVVNVWKRTA